MKKWIWFKTPACCLKSWREGIHKWRKIYTKIIHSSNYKYSRLIFLCHYSITDFQNEKVKIKSTVHQYSTTGTWRLDSTSWSEKQNKKKGVGGGGRRNRTKSNEEEEKKIAQFSTNLMRGRKLSTDSRLIRDVQTSVWSLVSIISSSLFNQ